MIKANVEEDNETTMARFLSGLSREIHDIIEMQAYDDIEEMLHKAILVEQQIKRRGYSRSNYGVGTFSARPIEEKSIVKPKEFPKPFDARPDTRGKAKASTTRTREVNCFK